MVNPGDSTPCRILQSGETAPVERARSECNGGRFRHSGSCSSGRRAIRLVSGPHHHRRRAPGGQSPDIHAHGEGPDEEGGAAQTHAAPAFHAPDSHGISFPGPDSTVERQDAPYFTFGRRTKMPRVRRPSSATGRTGDGNSGAGIPQVTVVVTLSVADDGPPPSPGSLMVAVLVT